MDITDDMMHERLQRLHADLENKAAKLSVLRDEIKRLHARIDKVESERDEARRFGENAAQQYNELLRTSQTVTCAFCGQEYPRGTPRHGDGALAGHIAVCPKHPMRTVERGLADATGRVRTLEAEVADLLPAAQRGNTWIYKSGLENLRWLKAIAEITNEKEEGFYSGQRVLRRVEELAADRDGLLALVLELSTRLDEIDGK